MTSSIGASRSNDVGAASSLSAIDAGTQAGTDVRHIPSELRRVTVAELKAVFDRQAIIAAVRQAFIQHDAGSFVQARPVHLTLPNGDCHIKSGFQRGGELFTIKIATGFYDNARFGVANNHGLILLCDQRTGHPLALVEDEGILTAWRTVAATVIAARAAAPAGPIRLGIVGSGMQAELAAEWLDQEFEIESIATWSRSAEKSRDFAGRLGSRARSYDDLEPLCRASNLIVTATPSTEPIIRADWVAAGTHVVAIGADNPGKIELDPALFSRASIVLTDDHEQCVDHGDYGAAIRAGTIADDVDVELGQLLSGEVSLQRGAEDITIADLTGLAVQDDAIASLFLARLTAQPN